MMAPASAAMDVFAQDSPRPYVPHPNREMSCNTLMAVEAYFDCREEAGEINTVEVCDVHCYNWRRWKGFHEEFHAEIHEEFRNYKPGGHESADVLVVADADVKGREEVSPLEEVRDTELGNDHDLVHKGRNEKEEFRDRAEFLGKEQNGVAAVESVHEAVAAAADNAVKDRVEAWPLSSFVEELRGDMELNIDHHEVVDKSDAVVGEPALETDAAVVAEGMEEALLPSSFEEKEVRDDTDFALVSVVVVVVVAGEAQTWKRPFSPHHLAVVAAAVADPSDALRRHLLHYPPITPLQHSHTCHHAYSHVYVP